MKIAVTSAFRNAPNFQIERWCRQIVALRTHAKKSGYEHEVVPIAIEGDSTDGTAARLVREAERQGVDLLLATENLRTPMFGSTEDPRRLAALSKVLNAVFEVLPIDIDVVLHVESDLSWTPHAVGTCIDTVYRGEAGVCAPLVLAGKLFYDVWGFRGLDGRRFAPTTPFYPGLFDGGIFEVGSVGSCLAINGELARTVRVVNGGALVGWCTEARIAGARIYVDPSVHVEHPA